MLPCAPSNSPRRTHHVCHRALRQPRGSRGRFKDTCTRSSGEHSAAKTQGHEHIAPTRMVQRCCRHELHIMRAPAAGTARKVLLAGPFPLTPEPQHHQQQPTPCQTGPRSHSLQTACWLPQLTWNALLMCVLLGSIVRLRPKSATLAVNPRGSCMSLRSSTLRALRSLCTMLCWCRCAIARATSSAVSASGTSCTAPDADLHMTQQHHTTAHQSDLKDSVCLTPYETGK